MKSYDTDILIVGAGPVGLMGAYLSHLCGLNAMVVDKSEIPLQVGRADALNARTLQLLELAGLFDEVYPKGKPCKTSSVWTDGKFVSRQSQWWDELEGCFHKHFLMLGQSHIENLLDQKLKEVGSPVKRLSEVVDIKVVEDGCVTTLKSGESIKSRYVIGSDGGRSRVRKAFKIPFIVEKPEIVWAVIDAVFETDFPKVPEIIVFQAETSDVAWIPREGEIDRFYVRMDREDFTMEEALEKVNKAMQPHSVKVKELEWFSHFAVKESVAEKFLIQDRVFLAGDACHIHSVNGGQGLNTGLADAFNLIWKLQQVINLRASKNLLKTYEEERKPVALSVVETSGELVRKTKHSESRTHAQEYVKIVERRSGNITGMGIRYGENGLKGERLHDFKIQKQGFEKRIYSLLNYSKYNLVVFGEFKYDLSVPDNVNIIQISEEDTRNLSKTPYRQGQALLVRPDSYIAADDHMEQIDSLFEEVGLS